MLSICAMVVRETGAKSFSFVGILGGVALVCLALARYREPISYVLALSDVAGVSDYAILVLKVLALSYAVSLTSELCRDLGEGRIASGMEAIGRAEILLLCLPVVKEATELALSMIA